MLSVPKGKFLFLLISLLFLCFFYPLIPRSVSRFLTLDITFLFILLTGIYAISENRALFVISLLLALTGFGTTVLNYFLMSAYLQLLGVCIYLLFFILMAIVILSHIMKAKRVTTDTIYGSICAYLLLGVIWTDIFSLIEIVEPGSFLSGGEYVIKVAGDVKSRAGFENLLYFSFVTLTTLGYGDITPVSPAAKAISSLEAVVGQLFIAVLIARLVGMHIVHSGRKE
jgi:hypothetical protein